MCSPIVSPVVGSLNVAGSAPESHSTPPAIPHWIRPRAIASAMIVAERSPVMQYEDTVCASMPAGSPDSSTISRARFGFPRSGTTTPNANASTRPASTWWRSINPRTAGFASASGPSPAYALPARTNGVRAPATIATRSITALPVDGATTYRCRRGRARFPAEEIEPGCVADR